MITPSANAIICIPAKDASAELCQALNVMNIPTRDNTLIEVVPLSEEPNGTALIVKNANGAVLMNDIIISIESNGIISNILYSLFPSGSASTTNYGSITVPIPSYSNQLIHVTVEFKQPRSGNYYQPQSVHMIYYSNGGDVVTNVDIRYLCKGFVFSYPDMVEQSEDIYDIYTHEIPLFKSVPESNTVYAFSRPYRNDRVIYVSNAPGTGHGIDFFLYINGVRISDSVSF